MRGGPFVDDSNCTRTEAKLGFTPETTGRWSVITKGKQTQQFEMADPFVELSAKAKKK